MQSCIYDFIWLHTTIKRCGISADMNVSRGKIYNNYYSNTHYSLFYIVWFLSFDHSSNCFLKSRCTVNIICKSSGCPAYIPLILWNCNCLFLLHWLQSPSLLGNKLFTVLSIFWRHHRPFLWSDFCKNYHWALKYAN